MNSNTTKPSEESWKIKTKRRKASGLNPNNSSRERRVERLGL